MKRQKRNNILFANTKLDLNFPGFFKLSLEHYYLTWYNKSIKVEIEDKDNQLRIRLYRSYGDYYTEQKSRTMTGDKLNDSLFVLDKLLILGVDSPVDLRKYDPKYGISYYDWDNIREEYIREAKKKNCSVPSDIEFSDCNEYLELNLLF